MSPRYLLDTNVLSEAVKSRPNRGVLECLEKHSREVCTAAPVWHELVYGVRRLPQSRRRHLLEQYVFGVLGPSLDVISYSQEAAEWHAAERARLAALGKTPSFVDGQIAAIAFVNDLTLVTHNTADFRGFADLSIVDWTAAG